MQDRNPEHARKRVIADVLVRDQQGRVLLVDDDLPGGDVAAHESPWAAAERALHEGLGLDRAPTRLLVVDYVDDHLTLIFDAGTLSDAQADAIRARKSAFCDPGEAGELLPEQGRPRLSAACEALRFGVSRSLQDGNILG
mgnify:CR=1 FL=1